MDATLDMEAVGELLSLCDDGDTSLLVELIDMFLSDGPGRVDAVVEGARTADFETVEKAAHSLKGSSGNLGATELMELANEVQIACRELDDESVRELAPQLAAIYQATESALRTLQASYAS